MKHRDLIAAIVADGAILARTRGVLGHYAGGRITDRYSFEAIEEEIIATAGPAVEALG